MRQLIFTLAVILSIGPRAQTQPYAIKFDPVDSSKSLFYCPGNKIRIFHFIEGVGNLYQPADSIRKKGHLSRYRNIDGATEQTLITKSNHSTIPFTIIVDTSQSLEMEFRLFKLVSNNLISTHYPGHIKTRDLSGNYKSEEVVKDTVMQFLSQPIIIANLSDSILYLISNQGKLSITQQAMNKRGKWLDIEAAGTDDDCAWVNFIYELKSNDFILARVMKFKGDYKTNLRIKLFANEKLFYSEPFMGCIDYNQIVKAEGK